MITGGEAARKSIHIGAGLLALLLPWLTRWQGLAICAVAALVNWQVLPRITHHLLERAEDRARGFAFGIILYPISVGLLFVLFGSRPEVVGATWAILAFGDGFATLAGRALGGPRLPWNREKSIAGFAAFMLAGTAGATGLYLWIAGPDSAHATPGAALLICACATLVAALVESLPTGVDDNLGVPLMGGSTLYALTLVSVERLADAAPILLSNLKAGLLANAAIAALALVARAVKPSGAVAGFVVGTVTWTFGGWQAFAILMLFFVVATGATKVGYAEKASKKIAQADSGRRGARHAIANCGVPAFLAFLAAATPHSEWLTIAMVAALATAVFDTVSSEIGQVYGKHPFLITTFRPVPAGTDGAVSVEGTLAGLAAAAALATAAAGLGLTGSLAGHGALGAGIIIAAAFIGTTFESYLGAISIGPIGRVIGQIDNEAMNFANTAIGAMAALGLCSLVLS